ncbi:MAG: universal stress protein, partial [Longimicrobiales bacterium]
MTVTGGPDESHLMWVKEDHVKALVGVDFGESSLAAAGWVSRWFLPKASLGLAYGVWMPERPDFAEPEEAEQDVLLEQAKQEGRHALAPLVMEHGPSRAEALVGSGTPAEALLELAEEWGADIIAVGPHGHTRFLTGFFGSTASRLLRQSRIPVLVVRNADASMPERILVAIDEGESTSPVLHAARDVVASHGCGVTGFHALGTPSEVTVTEGPRSAPVDPELQSAAAAWLKEKFVEAGLSNGELRTTVGAGSAGRAICSAAAQDADLIVMGTRGAASGSA